MKDTKLISAVAVVSFPILVLLYACAVLGLPSGYVVQFGSITLNMGTSALFLMGVWSLAPLIIYILVHGNLFGENDYSERKEREKNE